MSVALQKENAQIATAFASDRKRRLMAAFVLVILTLAFYNPVAHNSFVFFDDSPYILKNPHVLSGLTWNTVKWSFSSFYSANWHPLTWLSHALDCQLFGLNPAGHHYVSLLFHAANAVLVFTILQAATGLWLPSFLVAAFFALHPLSVESVAWAAERKNVLSMFFCLLSLLAYTRYARSKKVNSYVLAVVTFALGLMAKPQIIPLPFLLLLWDYWPLNRISTGIRGSRHETSRSLKFLLLEKVPFLILAIASAAVTLIAQRAGSAIRTVAEVSVAARIENSIVSYARYLEKIFWPAKLAPLYPQRSLPAWEVGVSLAVLIVITTVVIHRRDRPYLLVGWLWFLGSLIPTVGIIQVGEQAMADRYMYLPIIGILMIVVWLATDVASDKHLSKSFLAIPAAIVLVLGFLTYYQLEHWHDGETLWRYTLSVTPPNYMAHDNLAMVLAEQGRADEAIAEFRAAEALHHYPAPQILTLGAYEQRNGHLQGAIEQYYKVLRSSTDPAVQVAALDQIASAYAQAKDWDRARLAYENALAISPDDVTGLIGTGLLAQRAGNPGMGVTQLSHAIKLSATDVGLLLFSGALRRAGKDSEADQAYVQAQKMSVDFSQAKQTANQIASSFGVPSP